MKRNKVCPNEANLPGRRKCGSTDIVVLKHVLVKRTPSGSWRYVHCNKCGYQWWQKVVKP